MLTYTCISSSRVYHGVVASLLIYSIHKISCWTKITDASDHTIDIKLAVLL